MNRSASTATTITAITPSNTMPMRRSITGMSAGPKRCATHATAKNRSPRVTIEAAMKIGSENWHNRWDWCY